MVCLCISAESVLHGRTNSNAHPLIQSVLWRFRLVRADHNRRDISKMITNTCQQFSDSFDFFFLSFTLLLFVDYNWIRYLHVARIRSSACFWPMCPNILFIFNGAVSQRRPDRQNDDVDGGGDGDKCCWKQRAVTAVAVVWTANKKVERTIKGESERNPN